MLVVHDFLDKAWLVTKLEGDASFRQEKAGQYPDDVRNDVAARDLGAAAEALSQLPDDDPKLARLLSLWHDEEALRAQLYTDGGGFESRSYMMDHAFPLALWNFRLGGKPPRPLLLDEVLEMLIANAQQSVSELNDEIPGSSETSHE